MNAEEALVVIGAAGFGREVLDVVDAVVTAGTRPGLRLAGVLDDDPSPADLARLQRRGAPYRGTVAEWLGRGDGTTFVVGVGHPGVRRRLVERCDQHARRAADLVHPSATFGFGVGRGPGVVVCAGVQVSNEVQLGRHCHLNPNTTVGHDSVLEDYVSVNPGAVVSGACRIGAGSLVGAGAVVLQGLVVGAGAVVGAAACVTRDVRPGVTVTGVPAR